MIAKMTTKELVLSSLSIGPPLRGGATLASFMEDEVRAGLLAGVGRA
jgi:hypothetical protein